MALQRARRVRAQKPRTRKARATSRGGGRAGWAPGAERGVVRAKSVQRGTVGGAASAAVRTSVAASQRVRIVVRSLSGDSAAPEALRLGAGRPMALRTPARCSGPSHWVRRLDADTLLQCEAGRSDGSGWRHRPPSSVPHLLFGRRRARASKCGAGEPSADPNRRETRRRSRDAFTGSPRVEAGGPKGRRRAISKVLVDDRVRRRRWQHRRGRLGARRPGDSDQTSGRLFCRLPQRGRRLRIERHAGQQARGVRGCCFEVLAPTKSPGGQRHAAGTRCWWWGSQRSSRRVVWCPDCAVERVRRKFSCGALLRCTRCLSGGNPGESPWVSNR